MKTNYNSYKIIFADGQFPSYRTTLDEANSVAAVYFKETGKEAKIFEIIGDKLHLIKTWRKAART